MISFQVLKISGEFHVFFPQDNVYCVFEMKMEVGPGASTSDCVVLHQGCGVASTLCRGFFPRRQAHHTIFLFWRDFLVRGARLSVLPWALSPGAEEVTGTLERAGLRGDQVTVWEGGHGAVCGSAKAQKRPWGLPLLQAHCPVPHTLVSWPLRVHTQVCTKIINPGALFCFL